jgi:hypothetical protein
VVETVKSIIDLVWPPIEHLAALSGCNLCEMRIVLPSVGAIAAGALVCVSIKSWAKTVCVAVHGICVWLAFVTILFIEGKVSRRENSVSTPSYIGVPRVIGKEDEKFLDNLSQQQNQNAQREANPGAKLGNDVATAQIAAKPVRRAELIVNSSRVRRAQLVVNRRVSERGEFVRPKFQ